MRVPRRFFEFIDEAKFKRLKESNDMSTRMKTTPFPLAAALITLCAVSGEAAVRSGSSTYHIGGSLLSAERADSAVVSVDGKDALARMTKRLCGSVLKNTKCLAETRHVASNTPGMSEVAVRLAGRTVSMASRRIDNDITLSMPQTFVSVFGASPPSADIDFGVFGLRLKADAGAGAQYGATWDLRYFPPAKAFLIGAVQTWAFAGLSGEVKVLWGTGKASAELTSTAFNSTVKLDGYASAADFKRSHATYELIPWDLKLKAKLKILGITVASGTVASASGDAKRVTWF